MVEVRTITEVDLEGYTRAHLIGFHQHVTPEAVDYARDHILFDRTYGAFDNGEIVGVARSFPTELTVPGGATPTVSAVTAVSVLATHRRQGVLTEMMRRQLDATREPLAILIASEAPIYGRFGYGPAVETAVVRVDARSARMIDPPPRGQVHIGDQDEFRKVAPGLFDVMRRTHPGAIARSEREWDMAAGMLPRPGETPRPQFFAFTDGGYVRYRIDGEWQQRVPDSTVEVVELLATTPSAYRALWHHVTTIDWVTGVVAENRPVLEPLAEMLVNRRSVRCVDRSDLIWVRLLDVPAALNARTYEQPHHLVIEVLDRFRKTSSTYELADGTCTPSDDDPHLSLTVEDLGAAYLGGTPLWPAAVAGRVRQHRDDAVQAFDRMFVTTVAPWCTTWF